MAYTEVKERNGKKYYYRVISIRKGKKVSKKRKYLGLNLSKKELTKKEKDADDVLMSLKKEKTNKLIKEMTPKIKKILKKNKVERAGIFGSYVRGEQKKNSDIDILIEPPKGIGFGFAGIELELEDILKKKVDLLSYGAIHPLLKKRILKEEVRII